MYSRQEASLIRKKFWTSFGQYMKPVFNADGETINWVNYKTGVKHIFFRIDADNKQASISIELTHTDKNLRDQCFDQFHQLKPILVQTINEEWEWQKNIMDEHGKSFSRIGIALSNVNVFNTNDWPSIISFLKPRIVGLDKFWNIVKEGFS
jgi:hypothetical protein